MVNPKKLAKQGELDTIYAEAKARVTKDTDAAIAVLEKESEGLLKSLDVQVGVAGWGEEVYIDEGCL
jgi:hypothetical protein